MTNKVYSIMPQKGESEVYGFATMDTLNRLWWLVSEYECRSVIEVGSFLGMTAIYLSDMTPVELVYCVDLFDKPHPRTQKWEAGVTIKHPGGDYWKNSQYKEFLRNTLPYVNIHHVKMPSLEAAELDIQADMVYIDANHTYDGCREDILAWAPHARKVICGDDNLNVKYGVTEAVTDLGIPNRDERIWWMAGEELETWKKQQS